MLCPDGAQFEKEVDDKKDDEIYGRPPRKAPEGNNDQETQRSFKHLKTWKKSISNFFRNQHRSTKSNEGDHPSGSKDNFEEKEIGSEQKWQSLGKVFRRQSFAEYFPKSPTHQEESASQSKRVAVRKVLSSYFGKTTKAPSVAKDE